MEDGNYKNGILKKSSQDDERSLLGESMLKKEEEEKRSVFTLPISLPSVCSLFSTSQITC